MNRFFNTTGPCDPERHYMLSPSARLVGAQLSRYIQGQLYWVLHAPRQTGKTTFLKSWMREINSGSEAVACYVSLERCQEFTQVEASDVLMCEAIREYASRHFEASLVPPMPTTNPGSMLSDLLTTWAELLAPKPLVVLFDEVDVLQDQAMISFLRQLRGGFADRGVGKFPVSVVLVGMRDLRDYLIKSKDGVALSPGSPFNIKEDSASLANFSLRDVRALLGQHSQQTGQIFEPEACDLVFQFTQGQPWLVNALAKKCHWTLCPKGELITVSQVRQAKEMLIKERAVHLDSLTERLKDPRIRRVVQTILVGESDPSLTEGEDFRLALDLGLVEKRNGTPMIANPIYQEVIPRVLSQGMQDAIPAPEFRWQRSDGKLDLEALLKEFQKFWRRHSEAWEQKSNYTEAFPHLLLMAFLQRVINGGGRVEREYAAGRGRMDLAVQFAGQWQIIEIKLVHPGDGLKTTREEGLLQIARYRDSFEPQAPAYLVIFDRTEAGRQQSWEERLTWETLTDDKGKTITVVGG
jgi:hypothetical protein